ncbi:MAG: TPM domain-containing protein, partial [Desulfobacteraceae bacterium]
MKCGRLVSTALVIGALLLLYQTLWALEVPPLQGRINDYAGVLSPSTVQRLEEVLTELERAEGTQIVVLAIPSLEGEPLEEFSIRTAEKWGIGQKENDNGALLLIAKEDRQIRIEVGYGLEGRLTDLMAGRIIRNVITPQFKMGRFDQGVIDGVMAMIGTVKGEFTAPESPRQTSERSSGSPGLIGLLVLFFLIRVVGRVK